MEPPCGLSSGGHCMVSDLFLIRYGILFLDSDPAGDNSGGYCPSFSRSSLLVSAGSFSEQKV